MNFFKKLFGVAKEEKTPTVEELQRADEKNFDILKFDGVKALKINSVGYAIECFTHALNIKEDLEVRDYLSQATWEWETTTMRISNWKSWRSHSPTISEYSCVWQALPT